MGRHKTLIHEAPSNSALLPPDARVWVEGEAFVPGFDSKLRIAVDRARQDLATIGLTLMEYPTEPEDTSSVRRRSWTTKRVSLDEAAAILKDYPQGISLEAFRDVLFEEPPWTKLKKDAALSKTNVLIHKLKKRGAVTKGSSASGRILLFSTHSSVKEGIPPILLAKVRGLLGPDGEEWPELALRKFIMAVRQHVFVEPTPPPKKLRK